jgi:hypothetical protein
MAGVNFIVAAILFTGTLLVFPETRDPYRNFIVALLSIMAARVVLMVGGLLWHTMSGRGSGENG